MASTQRATPRSAVPQGGEPEVLDAIDERRERDVGEGEVAPASHALVGKGVVHPLHDAIQARHRVEQRAMVDLAACPVHETPPPAAAADAWR